MPQSLRIYRNHYEIFVLVLTLLSCSNCLYGQTDTVSKKENSWLKKNFSVHGGINASFFGYSSWGIPPRTRPGTWVINGNINFRLKNFSVPLGFIVSEQERTFLQPFNQYGLSPGIKWVRIHLGYRNMTFSPYTLNGILFRGVGMELTPGKFRFACMYGTLNRAVAEDTLSTDRILPSFNRKGLGFKIGVGRTNNYINLIYFQATDDITSIPYVPVKTKIRPEENKLFGLSFRLGKKAFYWENDGALSIYTRDKRDTITPINTDVNAIQTIVKWINPKVSTQFNTAFHSAIGLNFARTQIRLQYKRISPNYKSLGAYYFLTDVENITLSPSFLFNKNKLRLVLSAGYQRDNTTGTKLATTVRKIGAINISYNPGANYGTEIQLNNFGTTQNAGLGPIEDSLKQYQVTNSIMITQRIGKQTKSLTRNWFISGSYQTFTDYNQTSRTFLQNSIYSGSVTYQRSLTILKTNLGGGIMYNRVESATFSSVQAGPQLTAGKSFFNNKLNASSGLSLLGNTIDKKTQGLNFSFNFNSGYQLTKHQRLQANLNMIRANRFAGSTEVYSELRFSVNYGYHF